MFDNIRIWDKNDFGSFTLATCSMNSEGMRYVVWFTELGADSASYTLGQPDLDETFDYYQFDRNRILHTHNH